jgi:hypothetical protein
MALFTIVMLGIGVRNSDSQDVLAIGHGEEKYIEVGRYLDRVLPPNAVVYSLQHCGSIRYYSGRLTLRWDYLPPDWLDRSIAHMRQAGYEPFFLLDEWEVRWCEAIWSSRVAMLSEEPRPGRARCDVSLRLLTPGELRAVSVGHRRMQDMTRDPRRRAASFSCRSRPSSVARPVGPAHRWLPRSAVRPPVSVRGEHRACSLPRSRGGRVRVDRSRPADVRRGDRGTRSGASSAAGGWSPLRRF